MYGRRGRFGGWGGYGGWGRWGYGRPWGMGGYGPWGPWGFGRRRFYRGGGCCGCLSLLLPFGFFALVLGALRLGRGRSRGTPTSARIVRA